jgi:hypothetical protein
MELSIPCPSCGRTVRAERFHAGFSDMGYLYAATGATVLTWSTFDPDYRRIVGQKYPWMLSLDEQAAVEAAIRPDIEGGPYRFENAPSGPHCAGKLPELGSPSREYFVVTGNELDSATDAIWAT